MGSATLLLPECSRLVGGPLPPAAGKALAQADHSQVLPGSRAQLHRHFQLIPDHWPVAALTRGLDAGDAASGAWLRADPVHVSPDMHGARLLAHGDALAMTEEDAAQLLPALRPVFGDAGFPLDTPHPSRWYLRLSAETQLPAFADIDDVLGDDLLAHLPEGDAGRRWRALMTETQILLHQHPWNARRQAEGKPAINSLWFWGGGRLPDFVRTGFRQVRSRDVMLRALAKAAGVGPEDASPDEGDVLIDLRHLRNAEQWVTEALLPLQQAVRKRELDSVCLDFEDGACFLLKRGQQWRFWRRPLSRLDAVTADSP